MTRSFTPWCALAGGVLIGLSASLLLGLNGNIAGISAIARRLIWDPRNGAAWRFALAVAVAVRLAKRPENVGKTNVVILPDPGERYLSSVLFEGLCDAQGVAT